jgi:hypothetical protein
MTNSEKFFTAVLTLKPNTQFSLYGEIENENDFNNNVTWNTGVDGEKAVTTKINPHSEITWTKVKEEMDKL